MQAKILLSLLIFVISSEGLLAQFQIDAQFRPRFEIRDGYQSISAENAIPAFLISQRTRLYFSYQSDLLKIKITPQDVRVWGDEQVSSSTGVFGDNASVELFEAVADLKICNNAWVSAGRQQLVYDNRRILGDRNWNQTGISYDAVVIRMKSAQWNIHTGSTWNSIKEMNANNFYPPDRIKSLSFLWINRKWGDNLMTSFLHVSSGITENDTTNRMNFRHTDGVYINYREGKFHAWGNAYSQFGKNLKGQTISAFLADAEIKYQQGKWAAGAGFGYLSGNNQATLDKGEDHLFDDLYGNRHLYFGYMDYFRTFSTNTAKGGLADYYLLFEYQATSRLSFRNAFHHFRLAELNNATGDDPDLGFENDLVMKYTTGDFGFAEVGYMFYLPSKTLQMIQNAGNRGFQQFFYIQLVITKNLFKN